MANRLKRAWVTRATVGAAVFALSALGAGAAQAAIAGAPHETTTNRPDLVSVSLIPAISQSADFCFDKTLEGTFSFTPGGFELGGYRAANVLGATSYSLETTFSPPAGLPANSCVRANFPSGIDLNKYTIGRVAADIVNTNGGPSLGGSDTNNFADSATLTGSNTHNGTSGFTTGPDLASALVDSTSNSITFFFDQEIGATPVAGDFYFVDTAGNVCRPTLAPIAGGAAGDSSVTFSFTADTCTGASPTESVSNATRAGDVQGAVVSDNDLGSTNVDNEIAVSGTGATSKPDLTDVKMESNQSALDFTFNKTVTPNDASDFFADLSNGTQIAGNNASVIASSTNATTVRVTFPNYTTYDEYVVGGSVAGDVPAERGCAVFISALSSVCNTPGSQPLDAPFGNIGAFATGFTTGPDALGAVGNTTTNVVSIALDQRAFIGNAGLIHVLDPTGNQIDVSGGTSVNLPAQAAGPQVATVQFSSGQVGLAKNVRLAAGALLTNLATGSGTSCGGAGADCTNQPSVDQIMAMTSTASLVKAAHHAKPANTAAAARITKARRAAAAKKLASLIKKHHKHHRHH